MELKLIFTVYNYCCINLDDEIFNKKDYEIYWGHLYMAIQCNLSSKDLRNKDTSLIRTLPVAPAIYYNREVYKTTSENKVTSLIRTLHVTWSQGCP